METFRIGFGYDVHPLEEGARFVLGGVEIDYHKGATGHSDADVLVHAIIDALLGAAGHRDIGQQFPDSDAALKGADSMMLLSKTMQLVGERGYRLGNLDATVCLEEPKIAGYIPAMVDALSRIMQVDSGKISVKATTTEKLGFVGQGQGISAYAVVLIFAGTPA